MKKTNKLKPLHLKPFKLTLSHQQKEKLKRIEEWERRSKESNLILGIPLENQKERL